MILLTRKIPLIQRYDSIYLKELQSNHRISQAAPLRTLHCCKAHAKINRKTGNFTQCKIVRVRVRVRFSSKEIKNLLKAQALTSEDGKK